MNFNKVDLNLLVVFDAVFRARNITRAGEELHLTQSAVSNALRRLRYHIGDHLFEPTVHGMVPTPMARRLAGPVKDILARVQSALDQTTRFDPRIAKQRFRVLLSDVGQLVLLPKLLARIAADAPGISIETVATSTAEGAVLMERGEIDLAIGYFEGFGGRILRERLFIERYVCVVRRNHPSIGARLTLHKFLTCPHAVYRPTAGSHAFFEDIVDQIFANHGLVRNVVLRVSHGLGLEQILKQTDLIASLPSRLAAEIVRTNRLRALKLPIDTPPFEISQFWHQRSQTDGANLYLRTLVSRLFSEKRNGAVPSVYRDQRAPSIARMRRRGRFRLAARV